jgi:hypothetical protein
VVCCGLVGAV